MNKKIMVAVEEAFIERFGAWAGWAHNTLFISELATQRQRLPEHLRPGGKVRGSKSPKAAKTVAAANSEESEHVKLEKAPVQKHGVDTEAVVEAEANGTKRKSTKRARKGVKQEQGPCLLQPMMVPNAVDNNPQLLQSESDVSVDIESGDAQKLAQGSLQKPSKRGKGKRKVVQAAGNDEASGKNYSNAPADGSRKGQQRLGNRTRSSSIAAAASAVRDAVHGLD